MTDRPSEWVSQSQNGRPPRRRTSAGVAIGLILAAWGNVCGDRSVARNPPDARTEYAKAIRPLVEKYCLGCHSTKVKKGGLDLERLATIDDARKDLKACQQALEMLVAGDMPPAGKPQPTADEREVVVGWMRKFLD